MTDSRVPSQADKASTLASHESQDSQAILEAYRAEFGVGTLSSSPTHTVPLKRAGGRGNMQLVMETPEPSPEQSHKDEASQDAPNETRFSGPAAEVRDPPHWLASTGMALTLEKKQTCLREAAEDDPGPNNRSTPANQTNKSTSLESHQLPPPLPCEPSDVILVEESVTRHEEGDTYLPPAIPADAPLNKMDYSQQSLTQVNDDRDYSEFCDDVSSSPVPESVRNAAKDGGQTLEEGDTGAVHFSNLSELVRPSSQLSEDVGFENNARGDWRIADGTSQQHSSTAYTPYKPQVPAFETPAVPRNPFAAKSSVAAPLDGSQLFAQFSSAVKKISPTSSRPSPNVLHHSVSLSLIETSPLKDRVNVSSPTDIRTSSPPLRLRDVPNTSSREDSERLGVGTPLEDMIPESPPSSNHTPAPRSSGPNGPLTHYEPMQISQERKNEASSVAVVNIDSDSDDAIKRIERRKRIQRKRDRAAEEMDRVSFIPKVGQDSGGLGRKRRKIVSDQEMEGSRQEQQAKSDDVIPLVDDSQNGPVASNDILPDALPIQMTESPSENIPDTGQFDSDRDAAAGGIIQNVAMLEEMDMIPATSPAGSFPPTLTPDTMPPIEPELPILQKDPRSSTPRDSDASSSLPVLRRRGVRTYGRTARPRPRNPFISSSDAVTGEDGANSNMPSSPPKLAMQNISEETEKRDEQETKEEVQPSSTASPPQASRSELPPLTTTRPGQDETDPETPLAARLTAPMLTTSSSLSILSQTPVPSAITTPGTQDSAVSERPGSGSVTLPSPPAKNLRQRTLRATARSESPQPAARPTRLGRRPVRLDSDSTDELQYSPSASVLEKSMVYSRSRTSFRQSLGPTYRATRLFEGMIFAISLQNQVKQHERTKLEAKITQAGGTILTEGFQEMFEHNSIMNTTTPVIDEKDALRLARSSMESGFTALIADSHSRKAKYMQALALGLPCLAHQWITACLGKGAIVDWEPYTLCAGASAVLGNAIRSRNLPPYPAVEARFAEVIDQRPRLLDGQRILVVVDSKKARSEAKEPYIFLATVLGPSISRVFTVQQARETLREHSQAGNPFDWLYIDKGTGTVEAVLAPPEAPKTNRRKRKSAAKEQVMGSIRVLNDELVIQSLILGRMVEEDEMNF